MSLVRRYRRSAALIPLGAALALLAGQASGFPEPNIVPQAWELEIAYHHPRTLKVRLPGEERPRFYWYLTYTVTNRSGADRNFIPEIWMLTDAGDLLRANRNISPAVFRTLKKRLTNPLLKSPTEVLGRLLQGPDHAVDGVAIWPVPDHDVDQARVFFEGLSGETYTVEDPLTGETRLLRKVLMLEYRVPGSPNAERGQEAFRFEDRSWVVR